jgi:hypothetical protein
MRLTELNPEWRNLDGQPVLKLDCPKCRTHAFRIPVGEWHFSGGSDFEHVTVQPSIDPTPEKNGRQGCGAHFSITNGEIVWN